jgi:hypothetical protein
MFDSHQADGLGRAGGLVIAAGRTFGGVSDRANGRALKRAFTTFVERQLSAEAELTKNVRQQTTFRIR